MSRERRATYRLQLHAGFGFADAARILPYLRSLGVSHVYTSPYLQAAKGSTHGYDVVDHARVNAELGGDGAHAVFLDAIAAEGLGHIVDVVPNHMAIGGRQNRWWWDVLMRGPASEYARYFDVDWDSRDERLRNVVLLPVLGDHYGRVLEAGEIRLMREGSDYTIRYADHVFPVAPGSVPAGLTDAEVAAINASPDRLDAILDQQHYRLAWWKASQRDLGYRRFFDVNSLIGICAEDEKVFNDTHRLVLRWMKEGSVDGLRIDHPDGLKDPEGYLERLHGACPGCYVVVEKILGPDESLPETWPVAGTTGYDFMNLVNGLFIDPAAEAPFTSLYADFTKMEAEYAKVARERRLCVLRTTLGSDVGRLGELLLAVCERHRRHRDYTRHHLTDTLMELLACFPVYRTYVRPAAKTVSDADRAAIDEALRLARAVRPDLDAALLDFLRQVLTLQVGGALESEFVLRFQQLCAPAMAKGIEDTAFYVYNRFVALNEVGGEPDHFGLAPEEFHRRMAERQARYPLSMNATDTHDAKRGEDVRARLSVLSQMPDAWATAVRAWAAHNEKHRAGDWPDRNTEYLLYQTLVGAWPIDADRLRAYMEKAVREAKAHTSWVAPDEKYESALRGFIDAILGDAEFVAMLEAFLAPVVKEGRCVSLAQLVLKLTAPGVPDIYQGTELWTHALVDPDNRRPVDFAARLAMHERLGAMTLDEVCARDDEGRSKLWLMQCVLGVRAQHCRAFGALGAYRPIQATGLRADSVVAFSRGGEVITVVPRLMLGTEWGDTAVGLEGEWINRVTNERHSGRVRVEELLRRFPVAVLTSGAPLPV